MKNIQQTIRQLSIKYINERDISITLRYIAKEIRSIFQVSLFGKKFHEEEIPMTTIDTDRFEEYFDKIVKRAISIRDATIKRIDMVREEVSHIPHPRGTSKFITHSWGACRYRNLGHTRRAYLRLHSNNAHDQWLQIFVRKGKINYTKTIEKLINYRYSKSDRFKQQYLKHVPPNVYPVVVEQQELAINYIKEHEKFIISQFEELPLNKLDIREDNLWDSVYIGVRPRGYYDWYKRLKDAYQIHRKKHGWSTEHFDGIELFERDPKGNNDLLKPCTMEELANPDSDLYLVATVSRGCGAKVVGFAKSIKRKEERPITLVGGFYLTNHKFEREIGTGGSLIHGTRDPRLVYNVGESVDEADQYLDTMLDKLMESLK